MSRVTLVLSCITCFTCSLLTAPSIMEANSENSSTLILDGLKQSGINSNLSYLKKSVPSWGITYVGKVIDLKSSNLFSFFNDKKRGIARLSVEKYLLGGGKQDRQEREVKGHLPHLIIGNRYLFVERENGFEVAIPLEWDSNIPQLVDSWIDEHITRSIILSNVAQSVVKKLRPKWDTCQIYDQETAFLMDVKGIEYIDSQLPKGRIQFINGSIGGRIEPYIEVNYLQISENQAGVSGTIMPGRLKFVASLADRGFGASFTVENIEIRK